jgi:predicted kinase
MRGGLLLVTTGLPSPVLFIFSGPPGSGKTTLSQALASRVGAAHVRIDTIEQALRDLRLPTWQEVVVKASNTE